MKTNKQKNNLVIRMCKECPQLKNMKTGQGEGFGHLIKKNYDDKHMKRASKSLVIGEIKVETK